MCYFIMMNSTPNQTNTIQFLLNGKKVSISDTDPTQSVLYYLRENKKLMGTKEGCAALTDSGSLIHICLSIFFMLQVVL